MRSIAAGVSCVVHTGEKVPAILAVSRLNIPIDEKVFLPVTSPFICDIESVGEKVCHLIPEPSDIVLSLAWAPFDEGTRSH